ncbi:tol-pal system-associated acyl-CoA thioesterase [Roseateles koreensis]|uniref:Tol-pal system-associated acyl-CoA thioesterase n=1 Tax=Roseateles koreensis TaxID=2987526 RepID=A0ABT5KNH5_9BURK|nr:tol-pal system-associated acyl-CoA thioesterase [Roseateles koreensis]MDC8784469.1 tol-pal system-associated acyl-CoA thioesterase [Roseateles koreensis]
MNEPTSAYQHLVRCYWEDTDAGGVVFYANYLKFFERARTEWLRALGFEQEAMRRTQGVMFVVGSTQVKYLRPARLDDLLRVTVEIRDLGRASMVLFQQAWRGDCLLAEGEIRIGCVASPGHASPPTASSDDFKTTRIPAALIAALESK